MEVVSAGEEKGSGDLGSDDLNGEDEVPIRASAELLGNLRHMVNAPAFSDVVFKCNDGEEVHASRMLLAGRSDVLRSMLTNSMAESSLSKLELPEISSKVLLSVFEFLYTGSLVDYPPTSWRMSCEVIVASRFFLLPTLELVTRKFVHTQISSVGEDLPKAACLLTEAMEFEALRAEPDAISRRLVTILSSDWSTTAHVKSLSEDAFHYLLATTKTNCEADYELSFEEYLRFRQVIRWWVHQSESFGAEEILSLIAPDEEEALRLCRKVGSPPEDAAQLSNDWSTFQLDEESKSSVMRLVSNIDFRWIHPVLLDKVVEPLNVVPPAEISSAFRFHALRRPAIFKTLECSWELCESHVALEKGYVVQKIGNKIGIAVMKEAMSRSYGVYQWRFIVECTVPAEFCEVGFLYYETGAGTEKPKCEHQKLSDFKLSNLPHARVLNFQNSYAYVNWDGVGGYTDWKGLGSISPMIAFFNYDASEHTCSLSINGQERGVIWRNLPSAVYYPAVSLGTSTVGRVRVQLVSGFDII